jgi:hypothetical protein
VQKVALRDLPVPYLLDELNRIKQAKVLFEKSKNIIPKKRRRLQGLFSQDFMCAR